MNLRIAVAACLLPVGVIAHSSVHRPDHSGRQAAEALARAQEALGGATAIRAIRTFRVTGQTSSRSKRAGTPLTTRNEHSFLFPDHYLHSYTGVLGRPGREGYVREVPFGEGVTGRWRNPEAAAYLILGLLLRTVEPFRLELDGYTNSTLRFMAPNGVAVLVELDPATARPTVVRYDDIERTRVGTPTGNRVARRIELLDHEAVGQLRLPHRIRWISGDSPAEYRVESIELAPALSREDFVR
jgi:hypothetical protein